MSTDFLTLLHQVLEPLTYFNDPSKRIFWVYIVASIGLALILFISKGTQVWRASLDHFSKKELWLNRSSVLDLQWILLNHLLRISVIVPLIGGQMGVALALNREFYSAWGEGNFFNLGTVYTSLLFTAALFICEDFSRFFLHFSYHKIPWLWRFHAIHHSAPTLTPLTLYRIHSVEMLINSGRSLLVVGGVSGVFIYVFDGTITPTEILGANIFNFVFNMAGSNLRHSPVWLGYGRAERWFVSPAQHQIHHSIHQRHYDRNFGSSLALWDRVWGTWVPSRGQRVEAFGLAGNDSPQSLRAQLSGINAQTR